MAICVLASRETEEALSEAEAEAEAEKAEKVPVPGPSVLLMPKKTKDDTSEVKHRAEENDTNAD